jgi:hypothetical protein
MNSQCEYWYGSMGTFTPAGDIGNSGGSFSEKSFSLEPMHTKQVSFIFTPSIDLGSGEYTLMLGAQCIFTCTKWCDNNYEGSQSTYSWLIA